MSGSEDPPGGSRDDPGSLRGIPDALRRAFSSGMPKEAVDYLRSHASQTKEEAARIIAKEVREFLERADLPDLARRVLSKLRLEIKTEVKFVPTEDDAKPDVRREEAPEDGAK